MAAPSPARAVTAANITAIWDEARDLLLAGRPVIDVARELELPTSRVSDLQFRLREARAANPNPGDAAGG